MVGSNAWSGFDWFSHLLLVHATKLTLLSSPSGSRQRPLRVLCLAVGTDQGMVCQRARLHALSLHPAQDRLCVLCAPILGCRLKLPVLQQQGLCFLQ